MDVIKRHLKENLCEARVQSELGPCEIYGGQSVLLGQLSLSL